jgi:hypothetical protein
MASTPFVFEGSGQLKCGTSNLVLMVLREVDFNEMSFRDHKSWDMKKKFALSLFMLDGHLPNFWLLHPRTYRFGRRSSTCL